MVIINGRRFDLRSLSGQGRKTRNTCPPNRRNANTNLKTTAGQLRTAGQRCNPPIEDIKNKKRVLRKGIRRRIVQRGSVDTEFDDFVNKFTDADLDFDVTNDDIIEMGLETGIDVSDLLEEEREVFDEDLEDTDEDLDSIGVGDRDDFIIFDDDDKKEQDEDEDDKEEFFRNNPKMAKKLKKARKLLAKKEDKLEDTDTDSEDFVFPVQSSPPPFELASDSDLELDVDIEDLKISIEEQEKKQKARNEKEKGMTDEERKVFAKKMREKKKVSRRKRDNNLKDFRERRRLEREEIDQENQLRRDAIPNRDIELADFPIPEEVLIINYPDTSEELNVSIRESLAEEDDEGNSVSYVICSRSIGATFIRNTIANPTTKGFILTLEGDDAFGFVFWRDLPNGEKHVELLCIKASSERHELTRGKPWGKILMKMVEELPDTNKITLEAVEDAIDFYVSIGFTVDEDGGGGFGGLTDMTKIVG